MNILINATNLKLGGGIQVAVSFINEIAKSRSLDAQNMYFVVSNEVYQELCEHTKNTLQVIVFESSPSKLLGFSSRKKLHVLELMYKIDVVFSVFGPTYWRPLKAKHLVGFALPWLIYDTFNVIKKQSYLTQVKTRLILVAQKYSLKAHADWLVSETKDSAERVSKVVNIPKNKVHVVSNTASCSFRNEIVDSEKSKLLQTYINQSKPGTKYLLTITHPHLHKNLEIIPEVLKYINDGIKFVVTVPSAFYERNFKGYEHHIINLERVNNNECPALYELVDGIFLPSLLECFSANYPEAFISQKVVFTSDLPFARTVCHDAAYYFDPYSAKNIAKVINHGLNDSKEQAKKIESGNILLNELMDPNERARAYVSLCSSLSAAE